MAAKKKEMKQLKTPLMKHDNLASLLMEILPEEYKERQEKELAQGIIMETSLEAIYGDGMAQVRDWISRPQSYIISENEPYSKDSKKADM